MTAEEIDERVGKPIGWTRNHVGVVTRYECRAPESIISMATNAIELAMQNARVSWNEIDYIVDCSTSKFRPIPNNACHYQNAFGQSARGIPCVDVQSTCLGAILGFNFINGLFASGDYQNILLVASEAAIGGVDWQESESAALIGDGAAAFVLQNASDFADFRFVHETYAEHLSLCKVDGGGHYLPSFSYTPENASSYRFKMDGPSVFRVARKLLPPMVRRLQQEFSAEDCNREPMHIVPHQASPAAVEAIRRVLGTPVERYHVMVESIGNMAAASIPFVLDDVRRTGRVPEGANVMLLGTSAGYSQAALVFKL